MMTTQLSANRVFACARIATFGDAGRFATTATQIVKLGAAHGTFANNFNAVNVRRIEREYPFNAFTE
jgi:hypothetical protein